MKLHEKIYNCRRKAGLSQEELADRINVSRQAISKWETGATEPEISKLRLLAEEFDVTFDWLLSDENPVEDEGLYESDSSTGGTWVDSVPGMIGRLLRKYGWVFGVYLAVTGALIAGLGALARVLTKGMFSMFDNSGFGGFENMVPNITTNNPVAIFGSVFIVVGLIMVVIGVILAVILKKKFQSRM